MIKRISFFILLSIFSIALFAQQDLGFCGTTEGKSEWLVQYQKHTHQFEKSDETLNLPIQIHLVGSDNSTGFFKMDKVLKAFCTLNEDFVEANISFYMANEPHYISNTTFNNHDFGGGYDMMDQNNYSNVINCYIVQDPAGNCGYSVYSRGIALAKSCLGPNDHTWAHEVGHFLSLPHTFYGWEGDEPTYNEPAPTQINGVDVEKVDGSNCADAADGFCDTAADYLSYRWSCDNDGFSLVQQMDPTGSGFKSDGSFIMSYASDECSNRFSQEQIDAMRANAEFDRSYLLGQASPEGAVPAEAVILTSPVSGEQTLHPNEGITFSWEAMDNVTKYIVEINPFPIFSEVLYQYETNEPQLTIYGDLDPGRNYYWHVLGYNDWSTCGTFSDIASFRTGTTTATIEHILHQNVAIAPNPVGVNEKVILYFSEASLAVQNIQLLNANGQLVSNIGGVNYEGKKVIEFTLPADVSAGFYFLNIVSNNQRHQLKLIVQ